MNEEEWTTIKDFPNYFISTFGNVENSLTGRILKPGTSTHGYYHVVLHNNGKRKTITIHELVANAFIDNLQNKRCIDHIDNDRLNNSINNLRFATYQENSMNSKISKNNSSGYKGVSYHKRNKKWRAQIIINTNKVHIGYFVKIEEAKFARQQYATELFGEYKNKCEN